MSLAWGCASSGQVSPETAPNFPTSHWGKNYQYSYDLPEKKKATLIPVTIVVVNPIYKVEESALSESLYSKVGKGFSASMGVDMDKILIAKGMTTVGPHPTLNDVIYSHKKNASLTLVPKVFVTTDVKYTSDWVPTKGRTESGNVEHRMTRQFTMKMGGWISFVMQEPLSGEKMWVKKLELDPTEIDGVEQFTAIPHYVNRYGFFGQVSGQTLTGYTKGAKMVYDGKVEALADALNKMYPVIMQKCWTYMDTDEILKLKRQTRQIRKLKRY